MKLKEFQKDEKGQIIMSFKNIQLYNEQAGLFGTPQLNDQLYLHYKGFHNIQNLQRYTSVKALYLNNNAIKKIENLDANVELIKKIEGLGHLSQLVVLNLSHNRIQKIEGLKELDKLNNLILSTNRLTTYEGIIGIEQAPSLMNLDLSNNQIQSNQEILKIFCKLPNLGCLYLKGSPLQRQTKNYRKTVVSLVKNLTFLDDRPISTHQRRLTDAWAKGGIEEENLQRTKIYEQKQQQNKRQSASYQKLIAGVKERRKHIFQQLSKAQREQLITLEQTKKQLTVSEEDKERKQQVQKRIQQLQSYLQWLQQEVANTSAVEGYKIEDYEVQKIGSSYKLINYYDQSLRRKYQQKNNAVLRQKQQKRKQQQQKQKQKDVHQKQQQKIQQIQQDEEQKQKRLLLAKFNPQLEPLLESFLQKYKFDFEEVYPQFNMASASIYKKLGKEPVRFQSKQLRKIWTIIEEKNRNKLDQLD